MLELKNLCAGYGRLEVLRDLSLRLERGRIHALIGPSGCGKSTLLKVLCGVQRPSSGEVLYRGRPLQAGRARVGYVPQSYGLLEWKTVLQNIMLPLRVGNTRRPGAAGRRLRAEAAEVAAELGLQEVLQRYPREISGGQRQRAALARAFILEPDLLLMDEPFSALDAFSAAASRELFLRLWRQRRVTVLLITHNMHEAAVLGQRILLFGKGKAGAPGSLLASLENPAFGPACPGPDGSRPDGSGPDGAGPDGVEAEAARLALVRRMTEILRPELDR